MVGEPDSELLSPRICFKVPARELAIGVLVRDLVRLLVPKRD